MNKKQKIELQKEYNEIKHFSSNTLNDLAKKYKIYYFSINFNLSIFFNCFILYSSLLASDLLSYNLKYNNFTGSLVFVYFAPFPELCFSILLFKSVDIPVYKVLSLH